MRSRALFSTFFLLLSVAGLAQTPAVINNVTSGGHVSWDYGGPAPVSWTGLYLGHLII